MIEKIMNPTDSPVFIISSERSGTNLLRKRLTESQNLYLGPSPAHFLKHLYYQQPYYGCLDQDDNFLEFIKQAIDLCVVHFSPWKINWTAKELMSEFDGENRSAIYLMHFMMNKYAEEQGYKGYICKDNFLYEFALDIAFCIPHAKFIYLYRDPRDFVLSQIKRPGANKSVIPFARLWSYEQTKSIAVSDRLRQSNRCFFLSYEEFVQDEKLKTDALLDFLSVTRSKGSEYEDDMVEDVHEWKNLGSKTKKDNFNKFLDELPPRKIKWVEQVCHLQMDYLGYKAKYYDGKRLSRFSMLLSYLFGYLFLSTIGKKNKSNKLIDRARVVNKFKVNYRSDL
ncbi:MAG: sulfotransferase [Hydrogenovibrio sp.]|uniref:sulfotransferase n=1 Tax=Hydrogenovibrio sp. TaxID=2065821 RepID=UPI00286FFB34|nr:sulfotransferase [Hydrogenovibrio sp.]MDR9498521.1 sulfotransferase [Hydrogenovibrio sp.]MDR9499249.1 sulfotransferase [Hydrogenovibrio sp.]